MEDPSSRKVRSGPPSHRNVRPQSFQLMQILAGLACFGKYLNRIARREISQTCHVCNAPVDLLNHPLIDALFPLTEKKNYIHSPRTPLLWPSFRAVGPTTSYLECCEDKDFSLFNEVRAVLCSKGTGHHGLLL